MRFLVLSALALQLALDGAQQESPTENGPRGLVGIARREAEREREQAASRVATLLEELSSASDPTLGYVTKRLEELARFGPAASPLLVEVLERMPPEESQGDQSVVNRGWGAARALAMMARQGHQGRVLPELERLSSSPSPWTRALAAHALGLGGTAAALPRLVALLQDPATTVVLAAIEAIGGIGGPGATEHLVAFLEREEDALRSAAVLALVQLDSPDLQQPLARLLERMTGNRATLVAILRYLARHSDADTIDPIGPIATNESLGLEIQREACKALRDIALRHGGRARSKALDILLTLVKAPAVTTLVEDVAQMLNDLGDDTGVERVLESENRVLKSNPKHFFARYRKAQKLYRFHRYAEAITDCREGLRHDRKEQGAAEARILMAACYAGLGNFQTAWWVLRETGRASFQDLPGRFPELKAMAEDKRYSSLFSK
ncbi:MAG: HEAT repeat domain-containing protein [Planctomycetota bacterium]